MRHAECVSSNLIDLSYYIYLNHEGDLELKRDPETKVKKISDQDDVKIDSLLFRYGPCCIFVFLLALVSRFQQQTEGLSEL